MVNKCVVVKCRSGYKKKKQDGDPNCKPIFRFPDQKKHSELRKKWIRFVNRQHWVPSRHSGICIDHFEQKYLRNGKRIRLLYHLNPVPTIYTEEALQSIQPSLLPTDLGPSRKPPTKREFLVPDESVIFNNKDEIKHLDMLNNFCSPDGFLFQKNESDVMFYRIFYENNSKIPFFESIKINTELHVQLFHKNSSIPLPEWFKRLNRCKLTSVSILDNLVSYMHNIAQEQSTVLLDEMKQICYYQRKGRKPYSSEMLRFALMQRYTSRQAYAQLLDEFPLPSFSLLKKLSSGGIEPLKALKVLLDEEKVSNDCVLLLDEMYLQKCSEYHGGKYHGVDDEGNFYKGVLVFMIVSLKKSIPYVIKSCPEVKISAQLIFDEIIESLSALFSIGFKVRAIISDNHASNVSGFNKLIETYGSNAANHFFHYNGQKIYVMFDSVHLLKNIRNNLFNSKRFIFPEFKFDGFIDPVTVSAGEISLHLLNNVYDRDEKLSANLRKAHKLTYKTLHPGSNKQNVQLAVNIFHETTSAAIKSYFPNNLAASNFLNLFNTWWVISNSKSRWSNNLIGHASIVNDRKPEFLRCFADWITKWQNSQTKVSERYTLSKQTSNAMVLTLKSTSFLIEDLLSEGYDYVLTSRFQSDPIERRFSKYRQMSGGRFLVGLREVVSSEKILQLKSLLKEEFNFWDMDLQPDEQQIDFEEFTLYENELEEIELDNDTKEVAIYIAGYITKKLLKRSKCDLCKFILESDEVMTSTGYTNLLSRGGLKLPTQSLADYVCISFAKLDLAYEFLQKASNNIRNASEHVLKTEWNDKFMCSEHFEQGMSLINKTITNIYFNNKQTILNDTVRKDDICSFKERQTRKRKYNE